MVFIHQDFTEKSHVNMSFTWENQEEKKWGISQLRIVMVDFVLKVHRKWTNFEYKNDHVSKNKYCKKRENWFFIHFSTFRIFHVNLTTFEILKKILSKNSLFFKHFNFFFLLLVEGLSPNNSHRDCDPGPRMLFDWGP